MTDSHQRDLAEDVQHDGEGDDGEEVQFAVQMPKRLRDDAKKRVDHGALSEEVRSLFRRLAYGDGSEEDRIKAELEEVRDHIDDLRRDQRQIEREVQSYEERAERLEDRLGVKGRGQ